MKATQALTAAALALAACAPSVGEHECQVEAQLDGLQSDTVYFAYGTSESRVIDTLLLQEGHMEKTVALDSVISFSIATPNRNENFVTGVLLPGTRLKITTKPGDLSYHYFEGAPFYADYTEAKNCYEEVRLQQEVLYAASDSLHAAGMEYEDIHELQQPERDRLAKLRAELMLKYIAEHPDNEAVVAIISPYNPEIDFAVYDTLLSDRVKNGIMGSTYRQYVADYEKQNAARKAREAFAAGGIDAPDFSLPQMNGEKLALSDLRGKWVLLDFWGSWCYWCMKGMPNVKECRDKHKGSLEVLGINTGDKADKWASTVEENGMDWRHVQDDGSIDMRTLYAIEGYPTYVLVSPEGKVEAYACGHSDEFYNKIDSLLKK